MITEITKERLTEYFYPTKNFVRCTDNALVDYAEIEIKPVRTAYDNIELDVDKLVNDEEKRNIIDAALESLHKLRNTENIIDFGG